MIEKFIEWFSRLPPLGGVPSKLTVDENQVQVAYKKRKLYILLTKIWAMITFLILMVYNFKNVISSFSSGRIIFDNKSLNLMLLFAFVIIIVILLWEFET